LFPGKERDIKNPNLFQDIQLDKIFQVLGKPSEKTWPDIAVLPDWKARNQNKWKGTILERSWNSYPEANTTTLEMMIKAHNRSVTSEALDLLCRMIEYDPAKRITASQALDHPYFKQSPLPAKNAFVGPNQSYTVYPPRKKLRKEINPSRV